MSRLTTMRASRPRLILPALMLRAPVTSENVYQGASVDMLFYIDRTNFPGQATPSVTGLPSGVTASFTPTVVGLNGNAFTLRLTASGGATPISNAAITVTVDGDGAISASVGISLTVVATVTPSISASANKSATTALQGATDTVTVTLARTSYTGDVTVTVNGLPSGASATLSAPTLSAGVLVCDVLITNTAGATVISNDPYTIDLAGAGVTPVSIAMTHTITSPSVTRGIPNISTALKGTDFQSFADTAALLAQIAPNESDTNKLKLWCSASNVATMTSLVTSALTGRKAMRYKVDNTGGPPQLLMYFAAYPGQPTANRAGGVNTAFSNCAVYFETSYSPGFTTAGSGTAANGYKQYAVGYNNASGRYGMEWTNTSGNDHTIGWNGPTNAGNVGGNGSDTPDYDRPRPWNATGPTGVWTVEQIVCWYSEMRVVNATTVNYKHWTWLKGTDPTVLPQLDRNVSASVGTIPNVNRVAWGENFNQVAGQRYIPDGGYMDTHCGYVWDLAYDSNPLNL